MNATTKKHSAVTLISKFFKDAGQSSASFMAEYKALNEKDKIELASAIARHEGISESDCAFAFVSY